MTKKNLRKDKSKTTAILLAVFLGGWSWIYTSKFDAWKFWLNIIIDIFLTYGVGLYHVWLIVAWIWVITDQSKKPKEFYCNYYDYVIKKEKKRS